MPFSGGSKCLKNKELRRVIRRSFSFTGITLKAAFANIISSGSFNPAQGKQKIP